MVAIAETVIRVTNDLERGNDLNTKLKNILASEIRRRLNRYGLVNQRFCKKYKMDFAEFKKDELVKKLDYSFEVENDFCDWEMAISGIRCLRKDLAEIES